MTENENEILHKLLNDRSLCREDIFKKTYPELYLKITKLYESTDFKLVRKLYHYFHDVDVNGGVCQQCGKKCRFRSLRLGYDKYCSQKCYNEVRNLNRTSKVKSYETKQELIDLIKKSPSSTCQENRFKIYFPTTYDEIMSIGFPDDFKFSQKLYHYIHDDFELELGLCKRCGNRCTFKNINRGYLTFCSSKCAYFDEDVTDKRTSTSYEKYGTCCPQKSKDVVEKIKHAYESKTDDEKKEIYEKQKQTNLKIYGCECSLQNKEVKTKSFNTKLSRYGDGRYVNREKSNQTMVERYKHEFGDCDGLKDDEIVSLYFSEKSKKSFETRKKNGKSCFSKLEQLTEQYLIENNIGYVSQYIDERYPYHCDFYLPDFDLFIEIQGNWTHGTHPFNKTDENDLKLLSKYAEKSKSSKYYKSMVDVWSERDVRKRETAEKNNLNYLMIYGNDIETIIHKISDYLTEHEQVGSI